MIPSRRWHRPAAPAAPVVQSPAELALKSLNFYDKDFLFKPISTGARYSSVIAPSDDQRTFRAFEFIVHNSNNLEYMVHYEDPHICVTPAGLADYGSSLHSVLKSKHSSSRMQDPEIDGIDRVVPSWEQYEERLFIALRVPYEHESILTKFSPSDHDVGLVGLIRG